MPQHWRDPILRYQRWQDQQNSMMGKLLLLQGLKDLGVSPEHDIELKNIYGRPVCKKLFFDFNISHSDGFVICVINDKSMIGVDVERIRNIDIASFKDTMTAQQWKDILFSPNQSEMFFKYWTVKESVLKADGRGIVYPLNEIEIFHNEVCLETEMWHIKNLNLREGFVIHMASKIKETEFKFNPIAPSNLYV